MHSQSKEALSQSMQLLQALALAIERREEVFAAIEKSDSPVSAVTTLSDLLKVDESGARAILDMQAHRFTGEGRRKLDEHLTVLRGQLDALEP
ncbi:DNA gyrase subunit A [Glutamicibacter arilaitensis]|uniref:DNA gyrase subunit A n=1 Tax=Glutamicibacter arilaitensis TaxID=256701 RepID=UPI0038507AA3